MVESKVYLSLDIQDFSTNHIVPLKRGETGKKVVISLSDGGFPYHIEEGCYAVLAGEKPDGNVLFNHCDIDGDTIFYDVSEQTTAAAGRILAAINLYGPDDMLIVSAKFRILVDGTVFHGGKVESEPEVTALTHLISDAKTTIVAGNEMIEEATFARDNANAAAEKANNSAKSADDATTAANTAAQTAIENASAAGSAAEKSDIAASGADNARDNANAAASDANQAASDATAAAGSAISSAKYAYGAGSAADAAAASANAAAQEARTAADVANEAAGNANSAAENARSGADAANTAASRADTAAAGANTAKENAETAAGSANAAAAAAQAVVDGIVPEITQIKEDLTAEQAARSSADAQIRGRLDVLFQLNSGITYDFVTDDSEAFEKTVPDGCKFAAIGSIGGHSEVSDSSLVNADVASIQYSSDVLSNIPAAVRALPGYGWSAGSAYNSIARTDDGWQYVQRVGSVAMAALPWTTSKSSSGISRKGATMSGHKSDTNGSKKKNLLCNLFQTVTIDNAYGGLETGICSQSRTDGRSHIWVYDPSFEDSADGLAAFLDFIADGLLYYELETPVVTDITGLMADFPEIFPVEAGGILTFENAANLPVPSTVEYLRSLKEVSA